MLLICADTVVNHADDCVKDLAVRARLDSNHHKVLCVCSVHKTGNSNGIPLIKSRKE